MKRLTPSLLLLFALLVTGFSAPRVCPAQEPILEEYRLAHGGNSGGTSAGLSAWISDTHFGNGDARARLAFKTFDRLSRLTLRVWRQVKPGEFSFALLVFRVEIEGYDSEGALVYSRHLPGFSFGDSRSGRWSGSLTAIPPSVRQIKAAFFGNYE